MLYANVPSVKEVSQRVNRRKFGRRGAGFIERVVQVRVSKEDSQGALVDRVEINNDGSEVMIVKDRNEEVAFERAERGMDAGEGVVELIRGDGIEEGAIGRGKGSKDRMLPSGNLKDVETERKRGRGGKRGKERGADEVR